MSDVPTVWVLTSVLSSTLLMESLRLCSSVSTFQLGLSTVPVGQLFRLRALCSIRIHILLSLAHSKAPLAIGEQDLTNVSRGLTRDVRGISKESAKLQSLRDPESSIPFSPGKPKAFTGTGVGNGMVQPLSLLPHKSMTPPGWTRRR